MEGIVGPLLALLVVAAPLGLIYILLGRHASPNFAGIRNGQVPCEKRLQEADFRLVPYKPYDFARLHRCPVCRQLHEVNEARHSVAYGRQLTCSCECEIRKRKAWKCS